LNVFAVATISLALIFAAQVALHVAHDDRRDLPVIVVSITTPCGLIFSDLCAHLQDHGGVRVRPSNCADIDARRLRPRPEIFA
jgi:hypothetical protein